MAKNAIVSDELAKKFATEKDTPYMRWVRGEGLDIIGAHYVPNLHTVELKPWARRGGSGVFINHEASRTSNDCYVCEIAPGRQARAAAPAVRGDDPGARRPRLDHGVERRRRAHHLRMEGGRAVRDPAQLLAPAFQRLRPGARALCRGHQRAAGDQPLRGHRFRVRLEARLPRPLQRRARLFQRQGRAEGPAAADQFRRRRGQPAADLAPRSAAPAAAISASTWPRAR